MLLQQSKYLIRIARTIILLVLTFQEALEPSRNHLEIYSKNNYSEIYDSIAGRNRRELRRMSSKLYQYILVQSILNRLQYVI